MAEVKPDIETFAKIKVMGIGGGGGAAINRMVASRIKGVDFIAVNTDVQALYHSNAPTKLHIGKTITRGLGAGMNPEIGKQAAEESQNEIRELIKGTDMLFLTCGFGGGTGSGATAYIANLAKEMGILTVGVITKPFSFEGAQRMNIAIKAIEDLETRVDTMITIPNDRILHLVEKKTPLVEAFRIADDILRQGIQGISELITVPGLINVDFADVKSIMSSAGSALMGVGTATGENRAIEAARSAVESPLLELSIDGAKGVLFTIAGNENLSMHEVSEAAGIITSSVDSNARIIFGSVIDESLGDEIRITVIATGFDHILKNKKDSTSNNYDAVPSTSTPYAPPQNRPFSVLLGQKAEEADAASDNTTDYMANPAQAQSEQSSPVQQPVQRPVTEQPMMKRRTLVVDDMVQDGMMQQSQKLQGQQQSGNTQSGMPLGGQLGQRVEKQTSSQLDMNDVGEVDQDDLEIPAFIRKKMS